MSSGIWKKLFYSPYFFTIALRKRTGEDILSGRPFRADHVIPATYRRWCADPILADHGEKTYLFFESVVNEKGRIEVAEVYPDCTISEPQVVLEDACHYSYPFVFQIDREWYMIPESSASEEVRLYKARNFPLEWRLEQVLLHQRSVDTTVFERDGKRYLLTFLVCPGSERVIPQAYCFDWDGQAAKLTPIEWNTYDSLEVRGAGSVFERDGVFYRPAQRNKEQQYGNGVRIYEIHDPVNGYCEDEVCEVTPDAIDAGNVYLDGLHTYSGSKRFEAIDIRCREFELCKIFRVLWNKRKRLISGGKC